jgi:hypothetical protein
MKPKVYLETTVVSLLTARPTRDVVMAAMVQQTNDWWAQRRERYELFVAEPVLREAAKGDSDAARRRIEVLRKLNVLPATEQSLRLARSFLAHFAMPAKAADDALHVAIAATHGLSYLLTWNCRHIANVIMRPKLEALCLLENLRCPLICTPPELMGDDHEK